MTTRHTVTVKKGYTPYEDAEFGCAGHYWQQAVCSCGWKGKEQFDERRDGEAAAKVDAFDHLNRKGNK